MSDKNIMEWIREHEGQKSRTDYFDTGNKTQYIVRYDNGDTYQHIEVYEGIMKKHTETIINNKTVRKQDLYYHCFGWKAESTTLF